jgi:hypothetical protein
VTLGADAGYFLSHKDNSYSITYTHNLHYTWGLTSGIIRPLNDRYNIHYQIGYFQGSANDSQSIITISENGNIFQVVGFDLTYRIFPIEVSWIPRKDPVENIGFGVSIVLNNRIMEYENFVSDTYFRDQLFSIGVGPHIVSQWKKPIYGKKNTYLLMSSKLKWVHSIYYNATDRDLNNYNQNYLHLSLTVGLYLPR